MSRWRLSAVGSKSQEALRRELAGFKDGVLRVALLMVESRRPCNSRTLIAEEKLRLIVVVEGAFDLVEMERVRRERSVRKRRFEREKEELGG